MVVKPQPYVGVSGVASPEIQSQIETIAAEAGFFGTERLLAYGVKAVHKTQYLDIDNKYGPDWYPVGADSFANALHHSHDNPNTIAVAQTYLDVDQVTDPDYRKQFTARIVRRGQPWIQAIQFDMLPWHNDVQMLNFLEETKSEHGLAIFLQCHNAAMEELGPRGVVGRLGHYASFVDYLLFDASHGTGKRLDAVSLDNFLEEASASELTATTGLAVAGGLNESVVLEDLPRLLDKYPDISWDAEGQLHPINNAGKRPLNMQLVKDYLTASVEVILAA